MFLVKEKCDGNVGKVIYWNIWKGPKTKSKSQKNQNKTKKARRRKDCWEPFLGGVNASEQSFVQGMHGLKLELSWKTQSHVSILQIRYLRKEPDETGIKLCSPRQFTSDLNPKGSDVIDHNDEFDWAGNVLRTITWFALLKNLFTIYCLEVYDQMQPRVLCPSIRIQQI